MNNRIFLVVVVLITLVMLAACGGTPTPDVEATAQAAQAATEAAKPTDTPPPTDTPTPEPTDTPEPEPTDTPTPEPTDTPEPEPEAEALPLQDEPYIHPSGAFGFYVPVGWEIDAEKENRVTVGSDNPLAKFSVMYTDMGRKLSAAELEELSEQLVDTFIAGVGSDDYEVLEAEQDEEGLYVQIMYSLSGFDVTTDFLFIQEDTVLYVISFAAADREAMLPTLEAIFETYESDPEVAKAAAPAPATKESEAAPAPTPTPAPPPPTPTPVPVANPFAPQPGRARLYVFNEYGEEITFTIAGQEHKIPTGTPDDAKPIDLDPGKYTFTVSIPGGAVNGEVEMGADQSWGVGVRGDGAVYNPFQVYP